MNVGITGHQDLGGSETARWVAEAISAALDRVNVTKGLTCLAKGADQLYAQILQDRHLPYVAVIPCKQIEASFSTEEDITLFRRLRTAAAETVTLPFDAPSETAYFEAGKAVVDRSELIIAVWNGLPAKGLGGTADVVKYALDTAKPVVHINLTSHTVHNLGNK